MATFQWPPITVSSTPIKYKQNNVDTFVSRDTVTPSNSKPLPVTVLDASSGAAADLATQTTLAALNAKDFATEATLAALNSKDFATQTTLAAANATLTSLNGKDFATETTLASLNSKDFATETTLSSINSKDFATETTLAAANATLTSLNGKDFATETTLAALNSKDFATETTLAAANATLTSLNGKDFATQTTLAALNSKDFATEATLSAVNGKTPNLGQAAMAASVPVAIASNQSPIPTKAPVNTAGAIVNGTLSGTNASTETVPSNAIGFIIEAESTNDQNIRWCVGGTASPTVGMLMEPGRDSGFVPISANISICAVVAGSNAYSIQWVLSA
jgi:predicted  nucleic acid-binding Zn-ribbon protein